ncbi:MAG: hypothetical protein QXN56_00805, partial [Candidatus Hadarchaeum sp.]
YVMIELPIDLIGLDFTYSPILHHIIVKQGCDKDIGLGLIDGINTKLERPEEILEKLQQMLPALRGDTIYINPSCGLGDYLPREIAFQKLKVVAAVADRMRRMV